MKVLVYSSRAYDRDALLKGNTSHLLTFEEKKLTFETASMAEGFEAVSIFTSDDGSSEVLRKLYQLGVRFIALRCVGYDHVDLIEAAALRIKVANVPEYSLYAVAEHALTMLMAANRKILLARQMMELQDFRLDMLVGTDLHGKTTGVIGTGKIGIAFCKIMKGFGGRILAFDPVPSEEALALGVEYVSLDQLLAESDVVSIHCPLNTSTRHLFSRDVLLKMKPDAILVNTSRGAIVNTKDLIAVLRQGRFRAVCLDVYEHEKGLFFHNHQDSILEDDDFVILKSFKNVLMTGHQGFLTQEALNGIASTTVENLNSWQNNVDSPNDLRKYLKSDSIKEHN